MVHLPVFLTQISRQRLRVLISVLFSILWKKMQINELIFTGYCWKKSRGLNQRTMVKKLQIHGHLYQRLVLSLKKKLKNVKYWKNNNKKWVSSRDLKTKNKSILTVSMAWRKSIELTLMIFYWFMIDGLCISNCIKWKKMIYNQTSNGNHIHVCPCKNKPTVQKGLMIHVQCCLRID